MRMTRPDSGEFDDLIVARVLADTAGWPVAITETDIRASLARLRDDDARLSPEVARRNLWTIFPPPREPVVIDLADRVVDVTDAASRQPSSR